MMKKEYFYLKGGVLVIFILSYGIFLNSDRIENRHIQNFFKQTQGTEDTNNYLLPIASDSLEEIAVLTELPK